MKSDWTFGSIIGTVRERRQGSEREDRSTSPAVIMAGRAPLAVSCMLSLQRSGGLNLLGKAHVSASFSGHALRKGFSSLPFRARPAALSPPSPLFLQRFSLSGASSHTRRRLLFSASSSSSVLLPSLPSSTNDKDEKRKQKRSPFFPLRSIYASSSPPSSSWIEKYVPTKAQPYFNLVRLDKPIGTWLLLWPGWWGIAMATPSFALQMPLLLTFAVGSLVLRGAGCTINDLADRNIDSKVARTKTRPLASGAITEKQAVAFLAGQLSVGLAILLTLNNTCIALGTASLLLVGTYPLMKRVTYWPQAFLGLTFNYGVLMGWAAVTGSLYLPAVLPLYAAGICWTLVYDTIYAHQDREDDLLAGVKSTALLFGTDTKRWLSLFSGGTVAGLVAAGMASGMAWPYYLGTGLGAAHLAWQLSTLDINNGKDCMAKFVANKWFGAIIFAGIELSHLLS